MPTRTGADQLVLASDRLIGRTLAFDVRHRLREAILHGRLRPNERLRFAALRETYAASFSTLREALAHLVQEGLVVVEGQRGFRVAPVSRQDLEDLTDVRVLIEREIVRRSLARADAAYDAALQAAFQAMEQAAAAAGGKTFGDPTWQERHVAFHTALCAACESQALLGIRALLRGRAERYLGIARARRLSAEVPVLPHAPLLAAALSRDAERTSDMVEEHLRTTAAQVLNAVREWLSDS